jgi:hypothetical protein
MSNETRAKNKVMLATLTMGFPRQLKYAETIAERLTKKGYRTTDNMVYQTVTGNSYNPRIAWQVMVLARAMRMHDAIINRELEALTK